MSNDMDLLPTSHRDTAPAPGSFDANGLFARGNTLAKNNAGANSAARLRRMVRACATEDDVKSVFTTLRTLAVGGEVQAIKLYLAYTIGQPVTQIELSGPDGEAARIDLSVFAGIVKEIVGDNTEMQVRAAQVFKRLGSQANGLDAPSLGD
jgi:hypothetical protein